MRVRPGLYNGGRTDLRKQQTTLKNEKERSSKIQNDIKETINRKNTF